MNEWIMYIADVIQKNSIISDLIEQIQLEIFI